jgi:hypothetical protein
VTDTVNAQPCILQEILGLIRARSLITEKPQQNGTQGCNEHLGGGPIRLLVTLHPVLQAGRWRLRRTKNERISACRYVVAFVSSVQPLTPPAT